MEHEFFDVVNMADEVIGRRPRTEVHRLGLFHRAVHVLVFNSRGQVFLQKRARTKDRQPGLWDTSASGHVDAGEDYDTAAIRELHEELCIELEHPPQRLFKLAACAETDNEFVWVYKLNYDGPIKFNNLEIETGDWFDPVNVTHWITTRPQDFASAFRLIWSRVSPT